MTYVLIVIFWASGGSNGMSHDFTSKESCERAAKMLAENAGRTSIKISFCVPK